MGVDQRRIYSVAFIAGLFCKRLKTAAVAGVLPAFLYAALVVIGLWDTLANADLSTFQAGSPVPAL
jgi:hypothetical protein